MAAPRKTATRAEPQLATPIGFRAVYSAGT